MIIVEDNSLNHLIYMVKKLNINLLGDGFF